MHYKSTQIIIIKYSLHSSNLKCKHTPDQSLSDEFSDLALGDDCVVQIQPAVLPLHWAVHVQNVAEPVVGGAPVTK
jgi:hypothetical protein